MSYADHNTPYVRSENIDNESFYCLQVLLTENDNESFYCLQVFLLPIGMDVP